MKLKTSCFNSTLLKKNFSRFAVIWGLYAGCLFLFCTLTLLNIRGNGSEVFAAEALAQMSVLFGSGLHQLYAIICAVACFGYLHNTRSTYMLHALPMTRGTMFTTNLVSGWLFAILPQAAITLLNLGAAAIAGSGVYGAVLQNFAAWAMEYTCFYGLAVFCMVMTGKTVFCILGYYTLNYVFVVLEAVIREILSPMLFGVETLGKIVTLPLCPAAKLIVEDIRALGNELPGINAPLWYYLSFVAVAGIVLMAVSFFLYRKRHMENAGEVIAFRLARPIFKYFFTVCVTLILGLIITVIAATPSIDKGLTMGMIICLLIAGFIGFFAAEMMLGRTLRVFKKKAFLEFGIYAAILLAVLLLIRFDVFGVSRRVPAPDTVSAVRVELITEDLGGFTITDPDDIETVTQMHTKLLETHKLPEPRQSGGEYGEQVNVKITYQLKDGSTLTRRYQGAYSGTSSTEFAALLDGKPELLQSYYDAATFTPPGSYWFASIPGDFKGIDVDYPDMISLKGYLQKDIDAGTIRLYEDILRFDWSSSFLIRVGDHSIVVPPSAENAYNFLVEHTTD